MYDDEVRKWIEGVGVENMGKNLVNAKGGPPKFQKPAMTLQKLLEYGFKLVEEQENVKRVQLADTYLKEADFGDANRDQTRVPLSSGGAKKDVKKDSIKEPTTTKEATKDTNSRGGSFFGKYRMSC